MSQGPANSEANSQKGIILNRHTYVPYTHTHSWSHRPTWIWNTALRQAQAVSMDTSLPLSTLGESLFVEKQMNTHVPICEYTRIYM